MATLMEAQQTELEMLPVQGNVYMLSGAGGILSSSQPSARRSIARSAPPANSRTDTPASLGPGTFGAIVRALPV
jgi:hypothetical protein